jgi:hypothetical protein
MMNERIKELSKQAWAWAEQQEYKDATQEFSDILEQKFAEMIVRECITQINEAIPDTDCSASGAYKTAKIAAMAKVKDHFGIKE